MIPQEIRKIDACTRACREKLHQLDMGLMCCAGIVGIEPGAARPKH
jgi:hypothetical protein